MFLQDTNNNILILARFIQVDTKMNLKIESNTNNVSKNTYVE